MMNNLQLVASGPTRAVVNTAPPNQGQGRVKIEMREVSQDWERLAAAELIISEYYRMGYTSAYSEASVGEMAATLESYTQFVVWYGAIPLATLGLTTTANLPMDRMFSRELNEFRAAGLKVGEIGKFASRCERVSLRLMRGVTSRAASQVDVLSIRFAPEHLEFYENCLGFDLLDSEPWWDHSVNQWAFGAYGFPRQIEGYKPSRFVERLARSHELASVLLQASRSGPE